MKGGREGKNNSSVQHVSLIRMYYFLLSSEFVLFLDLHYIYMGFLDEGAAKRETRNKKDM